MKLKDWKIPYTRPLVSPSLASAGFTPLLSAVLALRGISSAEDAKTLIYGSDAWLLDPMLIKGMGAAVGRIRAAVEKGETVAVYGDYDVDGITSTCLLTDYLRSKGLTCHPYIPDREEEGYGLNCGAVDRLGELGVTLIITVDCGITAVDEVKHANALGIDMIITDHHECRQDAMPEAVAIIDSKQEGDSYPNKNLAGVGVALKLVCACEGKSEEMLERYADLAAIGTVADVMPLTGENRELVRAGLEQIKRSPRPGILAMLRESSIDIAHLTASTISYSLAPRLNAAGRLGHAGIAAKLLLCRNDRDAGKLALELCELNRKRQNIETSIWHEASSRISGTAPAAPIVLADDSWHQGVIGIAASRLAEQYSLPAIMICMNGDVGKGSCRSYGGFNLFEALSACSDHLIGFGGHALAAGLYIRREKLDDFRNALAEYYLKNKPRSVPDVQCDLLIRDGAMLDIENVRSLDLLEPYGNMNPKPVMCMLGAQLESASAVGGGRHLRMRVRLGSTDFAVIFFSHTIDELCIREGDAVDIAFTPQINEFRGSSSVQLVASAVRKHDPSELCRAILEGERDVLWAAAPYCPDRSDFVRVWRSLDGGFAVGKDCEAVMRQCLSGMEPEKFCICLMVLLETGLLKSKDGNIYNARCAEVEGKVDLNSARLITALRELR